MKGLIKSFFQPFYDEFNLDSRELSKGFTYDEKTSAVQLILWQVTGKEKYKDSVKRFCNQFLEGGKFGK